MESSEPQSGTPAPYGRACINCSRAKSKCILIGVGNGCERLASSKMIETLFQKITMLIQQKLLIEVAPSIDMLLGIMTFISWTTYSRRPFLNFYAHVLMGLVCDLGINQPVAQEPSTMQTFKCAVGWKQQIPTIRTLEERRAVLGCFLLTSRHPFSIALTMSKIDALRWNPHMEESLTVLMDAKECPEDELLVTLVKIQLIMDKVYHMRRDGENNTYSLLYTKAFQSQLDSVKSQIPQRLQQDKAVLLYLANAEIVIHEVAIATPSLPNSPEMHRLESLCTCLQACKFWLDTWLEISPDHHIGISFTVFYQFSRALVSLYKLSTLEDPAWDRNMVRNTANVLEILDRILYNLKRSSRIMSDPDHLEYNVYEKGVKMLQAIKQGWEPKLMEVWFPNLPTDVISNQYVPTSPLPEVLPMPGFDDAWMLEVFGSM
ncbi:uncharacterized protein N7477_003851 [Penicillium maclennaniae]|uniref:uncharacterized protein n=1 Tax=Penicillium maclennaniae TaxID=1343394 RepID=UPI0025416324|nr:uncharacterized protein N7477_003851 [Penicillium maclennaniae]KAJ5678218.1 hypothetical protein N7477_003851 [Penicillium maclennaniae]